jgi:hypothetical protein
MLEEAFPGYQTSFIISFSRADYIMDFSLKAIGFFLMEKKCAGFEFDYRKKKQKYE